jgi:hypothetical protein
MCSGPVLLWAASVAPGAGSVLLGLATGGEPVLLGIAPAVGLYY